MSRPPIFIADLKPDHNIWKLAIHVVDLWTVTERNGQQHVEAIVQDAKGAQIHAVTRNRELELWKQTLQEHQTYMIYNGDPLPYDLPFKVCDNKLKLFINSSTAITALDIPDIPPKSFKFKAFPDFLNGIFDVDHLYDVIGAVQQIQRTQVGGARKKPCVNLTLSDECGAELDVTLWETFANQFMNFASDGNTMIVILTHAMCRLSSTTVKLNLSNAWNGSKLLINYDHPQLNDFKSKFEVGLPSQPSSQALSISCGSQSAFEDRSFSFVKDVISIGEMLCLKDETFCNTFGTTKRFNRNRLSWFYEICPTCNTTNKSPGNVFDCNCCDTKSPPITKYKIVIEVEHENKVDNFVFWDKECIPIVGMPARDLREIMKRTNEDHPKIYPAHLDNLLDKAFAFHVKYQPYYGQASVVRLTEDATVIDMLRDAVSASMNEAEFPKESRDTKGKSIVAAQCHENNAVLPRYSNRDTKGKSNVATQQYATNANAVSAAHTWSCDNSYNNTPPNRLSVADTKGKAIAETQDIPIIRVLPQTTNPSSVVSAAQNWSPDSSYNNTPPNRLSLADTKGKAIAEIADIPIRRVLPQSTNPSNVVSAAQSWSPDSSFNNTPSKRLSPTDSNDDERYSPEFLIPKLSRTKTTRTKSVRLSKAK